MSELRRLRLFIQVAEAASFTQAAQSSGLSVAAISKNIAQLERALGVTLLQRTTRSVHLTDEGRQLYQESRAALATLDTALLNARHKKDELQGVVRLSCVTAYGRYALIPVLPRLYARHPGIKLDISFRDATQASNRRDADIRITWGESYQTDKVCRRLCVMPLVMVASPDYLRHRGAPRHPDELAAHDCIGAGLVTGVAARWVLRPAGTRRNAAPQVFQPDGRLIVRDELETVIDAALAGLGLTVVAEPNVTGHLNSGALQRVMDDYTIEGHSDRFAEIVLQYPRRGAMSARVRAVVDFLLEVLETR